MAEKQEINSISIDKIETVLNSVFPSSLFLYGRTGVGKSENIKEFVKNKSEREKKKFVEWNKISFDEKVKLSEKESNVLILVDLRLSQVDPTDITGIPYPLENGSFYYKKPLWATALSKNEGVLFLDEMNLIQSKELLAATYQILLDKEVGDMSLHPNTMVVGAGNTIEDNVYTIEFPKPVQTRFFQYTLKIPTYQEWVQWAIKSDVDARIVSYIEKTKKVFIENDELDTLVVPRQWKFLSDKIKNLKSKDNLEIIDLISKGIIGNESIKFKKFVELESNIPDIEKFLEGKEKFPTRVDEKYLFIGLLSDFIKNNMNMNTFEKFLSNCKKIDDEFVMFFIQFIKHEKKFINIKTELISNDKYEFFFDKYAKYIN